MKEIIQQKIQQIKKLTVGEKIVLILLIACERSDGNLHEDEWSFIKLNLVNNSSTTTSLDHPILSHIVDLSLKSSIITKDEINEFGDKILEILLSKTQFEEFRNWFETDWYDFFKKNNIDYMKFFGGQIVPFYDNLFNPLEKTLKKWIYVLLIEILKIEDAGEANNKMKQAWSEGLPYDIGLGDVLTKFTGKKTVNYEGGASYSGEFVNGLCHGKGKFTHADGSSYSGEYVNDLMHGKGTYKWASGGKFEGIFVNGKQKGKGIYFWPDGSSYVDNWEDGIHNAEGIYTDIKGKKYHNIYSVYIKSVEETKKILKESNIKLDFNFKSKLLNNLSNSNFIKTISEYHKNEDSISKIISNILKSESIGSELISKISKRSDLDKTNQEIVDLKMRISQLKEENKDSKNYSWLEESLLSITDWGKDVFESLFKDDDLQIRSAIAKNPYIPKNIYFDINNDKSIIVKVSLLSNPSCPESILKIASEENGSFSSNRIRKTVASNPATPNYLIKKLINDENYLVRVAAASHKSIDIQEIKKKLSSSDRYVLSGFSVNPNCVKSVKDSIENLLKDEEKYPRNSIEIAVNNEFSHFEDVHLDRFYANKLMVEAELLYETYYNEDIGKDEYDFEDWDEEFCAEYGYAYYFYRDCPDYVPVKSAFFVVNYSLIHCEATGINIVDFSEIQDSLIAYFDADIESLYDAHPWIADYVNEEDIN